MLSSLYLLETQAKGFKTKTHIEYQIKDCFSHHIKSLYSIDHFFLLNLNFQFNYYQD